MCHSWGKSCVNHGCLHVSLIRHVDSLLWIMCHFPPCVSYVLWALMSHQGVGVIHAINSAGLHKETVLDTVLEDVGLEELVLVEQWQKYRCYPGHLSVLTEVVGGGVGGVGGDHGPVVTLKMEYSRDGSLFNTYRILPAYLISIFCVYLCSRRPEVGVPEGGEKSGRVRLQAVQLRPGGRMSQHPGLVFTQPGTLDFNPKYCQYCYQFSTLAFRACLKSSSVDFFVLFVHI